MPVQGNASQESCEGRHHLRALIQASIAGSARPLKSAEIAIGDGALARQRQQRVVGCSIGRDADDMGDGIAQRAGQGLRLAEEAGEPPSRFGDDLLVAEFAEHPDQAAAQQGVVVITGAAAIPAEPVEDRR
jgi:hypothetical protein